MHSLSHVMPAAVVELLRTSGLSKGKVSFAWKVSVGPALERVTKVKLDGSVLIVDAAGAAWAREIRRSSPIILQRMQELLGAETVTRLEVRTRH